MARYRSFLFPEATLRENVILLDSRESHHLARVFRAKVGEPIEVLDGKGAYYTGIIQSVDAKAVRVFVESVRTVPLARPRILLLQSESKTKSMDIVLRMATEIGVSAVQPVFTEQGEHQTRRREKRLLVMIEACKQCGLSHLPELYEPCHLGDWLQLNARRQNSLAPGGQPGRGEPAAFECVGEVFRGLRRKSLLRSARQVIFPVPNINGCWKQWFHRSPARRKCTAC